MMRLQVIAGLVASLATVMVAVTWQSGHGQTPATKTPATKTPATKAPATKPAAGPSGSVTLIHIGDIHGHLVPRPNLRRDASAKTAGGVARMHTRIEEIRKRRRNTLLVNTGDTIQGSAEALFTRGQAMVDVLNLLKIDVFAPGNWDFVYGPARFIEFFGEGTPKAPWGTVAANVYFDGEPYADRTGKTVVPPYRIRQIGALKIGIMGLTTRRGPQVVGKNVTKGFKFTSGEEEVPRLLKELREQENVHLVVLLSEQELANNIRLAEKNPGINVILSSDMHEVTRRPIETSTGTIIVEEGQDGTMLGELTLEVDGGKLRSWSWTPHLIDESIAESRVVAAKVAEVRKSFVTGPAFTKHKNPFNGTELARPIDTVVGETKVALHRSGFTDDAAPAVIEGSSHNFLTDAFRTVAKADIGAIRGFRYGTHVAPGPIRMEDLYHYIPIGPLIAKGTIKGQQLKNQLENSAEGALSTDVASWTGGWLFNFSGVTADIDPGAGKGKRASAIMVSRADGSGPMPLDPAASYTYASYYYAADPTLINVVPSTEIAILKDDAGNPLDGVEVVVRYLQSLPGRSVAAMPTRLRLKAPLPKPAYGNPEVQPLRGVPAR
ncbi:MAG TPA: bifunctional metallophosphatase/5'-nucleotidase [Hyphomicrobiaceae bacterium]|nr:bifunctional metallophosphatase/5'-nucleotidase [Hyphomicrobiaceae bacterium]